MLEIPDCVIRTPLTEEREVDRLQERLARQGRAGLVPTQTLQESMQQRKRMNRLRTEYGWSQGSFEAQLRRQNRACAGCCTALDWYTARVDHCHKTGRVRGLLCNDCNLAVGFAKDNAVALRRLSEYLEPSRDLRDEGPSG